MFSSTALVAGGEKGTPTDNSVLDLDDQTDTSHGDIGRIKKMIHAQTDTSHGDIGRIKKMIHAQADTSHGDIDRINTMISQLKTKEPNLLDELSDAKHKMDILTRAYERKTRASREKVTMHTKKVDAVSSASLNPTTSRAQGSMIDHSQIQSGSFHGQGPEDFCTIHKGDMRKSSSFAENPVISCTYDNSSRLSYCVSAEVQLKGVWNVHILPPDRPLYHGHNRGIRFYQLIDQGLRLHPGVHLVDHTEAADLVFLLPTRTKHVPFMDPATNKPVDTEASKLARQKLVILDEGDGSGHIRQVKNGNYLAYFKRSWVNKENGTYSGKSSRFAHNYFPMSYSISDNYTDGLLRAIDRPYSIVSTLRRNPKQPARGRVLDWLEQAVKDKRLENLTQHAIIGEVNTAGRRGSLSGEYLDFNRNARIVVTCNPSRWEGDYRLWEALGSGALVFVDQMHTPLPDPLRHGEHVILFDTHDKAAFLRKLTYYLMHPFEARRIALHGYLRSMRYHRTISRVDYILRSAHSLLMQQKDVEETTAYSKTGQHVIRDAEYLMRLDGKNFSI
jgi:hypothetical protein